MSDDELMQSLGLLAFGNAYRPEWVDLGTAQIESSSGRNAQIKIEISRMPAKFWRFTIDRPRDVPDPSGKGWLRDVIVVSTGSGDLENYWPTVKLIAQNMLSVERAAAREERVVSEPSHKALQAAVRAGNRDAVIHPAEDVLAMMEAAHDPALGLDRSVCLRDVVEALKVGEGSMGWKRMSYWSAAARFVEREFGGES